ncbi:hypothetical protein Dimus_037522 [Dionaea muscipula]
MKKKRPEGERRGLLPTGVIPPGGDPFSDGMTMKSTPASRAGRDRIGEKNGDHLSTLNEQTLVDAVILEEDPPLSQMGTESVAGDYRKSVELNRLNHLVLCDAFGRWGHKSDKCYAGKNVRGAPVMAWKKKDNPVRDPGGVLNVRASERGLNALATRAPVLVSDGGMGVTRLAGCSEEWHEVNNRRNGSQGYLLKRQVQMPQVGMQLVGRCVFDQLQ